MQSASTSTFDPALTIEKALPHEKQWIYIQKKWKSCLAFRKIEKFIGLDLIDLSQKNLTRLRREVVGLVDIKATHLKRPVSSMSPKEELFFNLFCELDFTFTHGTTPSNFLKMHQNQFIFSYDELKRKNVGAVGLSAACDIALGNTEMVYGVLGTPGSTFPLLGDRRDAFIFNLKCFLKETDQKPFMARLSDWYWFESQRELHPCMVGTTLRRVVHAIIDNERVKIYIYEHQNGESEFFTVRRGDEEFANHTFAPAIAFMMIKELRIVQKGDPAFYEHIFNSFSSDQENTAEIQALRKKILIDLFHTLYSPEVTVPCSIDIGVKGKNYMLSLGFSSKEAKIKALHEALGMNDLEEIDQILEKYPELIDAVSVSSGRTLLMEAAATGNEEIAKYLLAKGANPYVKTNTDRLSALCFAILGSRVEIVKLLLKLAKGNVNDLISSRNSETESHRWKRYHSPLMLAGQVGNTEIIDLLLEAGARPRKQHVVVAIPMYFDISGSYFLLGQKCYKNDMHSLVAYGDMALPGCLKEEVVQDSLLAAKRNLKFLTTIESDRSVVSAIYTHSKLSDDQSTRHQTDFVLVNFGRNKFLPSSTGHLLNLAWMHSSELKAGSVKPSNLTILRSFSSHSMAIPVDEINPQLYLESEGVNLLHAAIRTNNLKKMEWLLDQQVPIEGKIDFYHVNCGYAGRYTPLMAAIFLNNQQAIKLLLSRGADSDIVLKDKDKSLQELVIKNKNRIVLKQFLRSSTLELPINTIHNLIEKNDKKTIELIFRKFENIHSLYLDPLDISFFMKKENEFLLKCFLARKPKNQDIVLFEIALRAISRRKLSILKKIDTLQDWDYQFYDSMTTPLHVACQVNDPKAVQVLIEKGAGSCLVSDFFGKVPLQYAQENDSKEIMEVISSQTLPYQLMLKCGVMIRQTHTQWVLFYYREDAWRFYCVLKNGGYACSHPSSELKVHVKKETLVDFIEGKAPRQTTRKEPSTEVIQQVEKLFKVSPVKMEKGYSSFSWDLYFDPDTANVEMLAEEYEKASPSHPKLTYCQEDNSINMNAFNLVPEKPFPPADSKNEIFSLYSSSIKYFAKNKIDRSSNYRIKTVKDNINDELIDLNSINFF